MDNVTGFIPHRPPFLYVDEILELTDTNIVTSKRIDPAEPFFEGHYPGNPIMPGVLLCEAVFQSGAILIASICRNKGGGGADGTPVLTRISSAKFKKIVRPGDTITICTSIKEAISNAYYMKGNVTVDGKAAVTVEFACCVVKG